MAYEFIDADTVVNPKGDAFRINGGNAPETVKNFPDHPQDNHPNEVGAQESLRIAQDIGDLSNIGNLHQSGSYGRGLATLQTKDGRDFTGEMIKQGAMVPMDFGGKHPHDYERERMIADQSYWGNPNDRMRNAVSAESHANPTPEGLPQEARLKRGLFSTAGSSFARGMDQTESMLGHFASGVTQHLSPETSKNLDLWARQNENEAQLQNPAEIGDSSNIKGIGGAAKYAVEAIAGNAPQALPLLAAGAAAAATGGLTAAGGVGLALANGAWSTALNTGGTYGEMKEHGQDNFGAALEAGVPMGLLDTAGVAPVAGMLLKNAGRKVGVNLWNDLGKGAVTGFAAEAPTEYAQEAIQINAVHGVDPTFDPNSKENQHRKLEAGLQGGLAGGGMGVMAGGYNSLSHPNETNFGHNLADGSVSAKLASGLTSIYNDQGMRPPMFDFNAQVPGFDAKTGVVSLPKETLDMDAREQTEAAMRQMGGDVLTALPKPVRMGLQVALAGNPDVTLNNALTESFLRYAHSDGTTSLIDQIGAVSSEVAGGAFVPGDFSASGAKPVATDVDPNADQNVDPNDMAGGVPVPDAAEAEVAKTAAEAEAAKTAAEAEAAKTAAEAEAAKTAAEAEAAKTAAEAEAAKTAAEAEAAKTAAEAEAAKAEPVPIPAVENEIVDTSGDKRFQVDGIDDFPASIPAAETLEPAAEDEIVDANGDKRFVVGENASAAEVDPAVTETVKPAKNTAELVSSLTAMTSSELETASSHPALVPFRDLVNQLIAKKQKEESSKGLPQSDTGVVSEDSDVALEKSEDDETDDTTDDDEEGEIGHESDNNGVNITESPEEDTYNDRELFHGPFEGDNSSLDHTSGFTTKAEAREHQAMLEKKQEPAADPFNLPPERGTFEVVPRTETVSLTAEAARLMKEKGYNIAPSKGSIVATVGRSSYELTTHVVKETTPAPVRSELRALEQKEKLLESMGNEIKSARIELINPQGEKVYMDSTRLTQLGRGNVGTTFEEPTVTSIKRNLLQGISVALDKGYKLPDNSVHRALAPGGTVWTGGSAHEAATIVESTSKSRADRLLHLERQLKKANKGAAITTAALEKLRAEPEGDATFHELLEKSFNEDLERDNQLAATTQQQIDYHNDAPNRQSRAARAANLEREIEDLRAQSEIGSSFYKKTKAWLRHERDPKGNPVIPDHMHDGKLRSHASDIKALEAVIARKGDSPNKIKAKALLANITSKEGIGRYRKSWEKSIDATAEEHRNSTFSGVGILGHMHSDLTTALNEDQPGVSREVARQDLVKGWLKSMLAEVKNKLKEVAEAAENKSKAFPKSQGYMEYTETLRKLVPESMGMAEKAAKGQLSTEGYQELADLIQAKIDELRKPLTDKQAELNALRPLLSEDETKSKSIGTSRDKEAGHGDFEQIHYGAGERETLDVGEFAKPKITDRNKGGGEHDEAVKGPEADGKKTALARKFDEDNNPVLIPGVSTKFKTEVSRPARTNNDIDGKKDQYEATEPSEARIAERAKTALDFVKAQFGLWDKDKGSYPSKTFEAVPGLKALFESKASAAEITAAEALAIVDGPKSKVRRNYKAEGSGPSIARSVVDKTVAAFAARFPQVNISVVPTLSDGSAGLFSDGKVSIAADKIRSVEQLERILRHEVIGHYGIRASMSAAEFQSVLDDLTDARKTDPAIAAIYDEIAAKYTEADANELADEVIARVAEESQPTSRMRQLLNTLIRGLRKAFGMKTPMSVSELKSLVATAERKLENGAVMEGHESADRNSFGLAKKNLKALHSFAESKELGRWALDKTDKAVKSLDDTWLPAIFQSLNGRLRGTGEIGNLIGSHFWQTTGSTLEGDVAKEPELLQVFRDTFKTNELEPLLALLPRVGAKDIFNKAKKDAVAAEHARIADALITGAVSTDPIVGKVREFMKKIQADLAQPDLGLAVSSDYPGQYNREALQENYQQALDNLVKSFTDTGIAYGMRMDATVQADIRDLSVDVLDGLISATGSVHDINLTNVLANRFQYKVNERDAHIHKSQYEWIRTALAPYTDKDIARTLTSFTDAAYKRAILEHKFSKIRQNAAGEDYTDPMGVINDGIETALATKDITPKQAHWLRNAAVPALLGTLGSDISPKMQKAQSWALTYFNSVMLPLTLASNFVDIGQIGIRAGDLSAPVRNVAKYWSSSQKREAAKYLANLIGATSKSLVDHMSNEAALGGMSATPEKINNALFKVNGMNSWTHFTRTIGVMAAQESFGDYAKHARNDKPWAVKELLELGISADEADAIHRWDSSKAPLSTAQKVALNRWINGAIVRPQASLRPVWGSDHRKVLLWYLKNYMWGLYETTLKRVYTQMDRQTPAKTMLPLLIAGAALIPLAAGGYELRNAISGGRTKKGDEYWPEIISRSGILGPGALVLDTVENNNSGRIALMDLGGPVVSRAQDLLTQPVANSLSKSIPVLSAFATPRNAMRKEIQQRLK